MSSQRIPLDIPPGIVADDTHFSIEGQWADADKVRFWRSKAQTIGGWQSVTASLLSGVCRAVLSFTDNADNQLLAFGTNTKLYVYDTSLHDITPTLEVPAHLLPFNAFTVGAIVGSTTTLKVNAPNHELTTGDTIVITGAGNVGGVFPNGTFTVTVVDPDNFTIVYPAIAAGTFGTSISTVSGQLTITIVKAGHGLETGTIVDMTTVPVGGITPTISNVPVTVIDANTFTYQFTSAAVSTATVSTAGNSTFFADPSGGSTATFASQAPFIPGNVDGSASTFPMTWSLANYGQSLMANPRGDSIYWWQNDTGITAAPLLNAPQVCTYMLVTPQRQVLAFGCTDEGTSVFNPMAVRGSDIEDPTDWTSAITNNAFEDVLQGGGRIVGARLVGEYVFAWSDFALFQGTFLGNPDQTYQWTKLGEKCGLIGPNAAVIFGQTAWWLGTDLQFRTCVLGGEPTIIGCPVLDELIANLAPFQHDKIVASSVSQYGEIRFEYPDARDAGGGANKECSRYVSLSVLTGWWSKGIWEDSTGAHLGRSAACDAGPSPNPLGVCPDGSIYYHEMGQDADGAAFSWFIESADQYFANAENLFEVKGIWPDFKDQVGDVDVTIYPRLYPQSTERVKGPFTLAPGRQKKDFRATGRIARIRIAGNAAPTYCRLGKPSLEAVSEGER